MFPTHRRISGQFNLILRVGTPFTGRVRLARSPSRGYRIAVIPGQESKAPASFTPATPTQEELEPGESRPRLGRSRLLSSSSKTYYSVYYR